jgi:hypothetical protein
MDEGTRGADRLNARGVSAEGATPVTASGLSRRRFLAAAVLAGLATLPLPALASADTPTLLARHKTTLDALIAALASIAHAPDGLSVRDASAAVQAAAQASPRSHGAALAATLDLILGAGSADTLDRRAYDFATLSSKGRLDLLRERLLEHEGNRASGSPERPVVEAVSPAMAVELAVHLLTPLIGTGMRFEGDVVAARIRTRSY